jgi:phosphomannomutase / phosphoglucomutase
VVDNTGEEVFADKLGVMLARYMSVLHANAQLVVHVKSTGLFVTDSVLQKQGATTHLLEDRPFLHEAPNPRIGRTGGFEKSGHFFFNAPFGRGYDDGLLSAIAVCEMLDRAPGQSMACLKNALLKTWSSPTMSPHCAEQAKYGVVERVVSHFEAMQNKREKVAGQKIRDLVTVDAVRVTVEDGSWGLLRASSNKPELVVVVESPVSEQRMRDLFEAMDSVLRTDPEIGAYNYLTTLVQISEVGRFAAVLLRSSSSIPGRRSAAKSGVDELLPASLAAFTSDASAQRRDKGRDLSKGY